MSALMPNTDPLDISSYPDLDSLSGAVEEIVAHYMVNSELHPTPEEEYFLQEAGSILVVDAMVRAGIPLDTAVSTVESLVDNGDYSLSFSFMDGDFVVGMKKEDEEQ